MPHPQQNWVVQNLKLDSNETKRRGYVQKGADSILEEGGDYSPRSEWCLAGRALGKGSLSHSSAARFPSGPQELCALLGKGPQLFSWVIEVTKAKWPPGALARAGHGHQMAPARPLSARHPQPLTPSHTLCRASPGAA